MAGGGHRGTAGYPVPCAVSEVIVFDAATIVLPAGMTDNFEVPRARALQAVHKRPSRPTRPPEQKMNKQMRCMTCKLVSITQEVPRGRCGADVGAITVRSMVRLVVAVALQMQRSPSHSLSSNPCIAITDRCA